MTDEERIIRCDDIGHWVIELVVQIDEPLVRIYNGTTGYYTEDYFTLLDEAETAFYMAVSLLRTTVEG